MSRLCRRTGDVRRYNQQEQHAAVFLTDSLIHFDPKFTDHPAPECLIRWVWRGSLWVFKPTSFWGCPHFDPELRNVYQCTTRPLDFHQAACYWILPLLNFDRQRYRTPSLHRGRVAHSAYPTDEMISPRPPAYYWQLLARMFRKNWGQNSSNFTYSHIYYHPLYNPTYSHINLTAISKIFTPSFYSVVSHDHRNRADLWYISYAQFR